MRLNIQGYFSFYCQTCNICFSIFASTLFLKQRTVYRGTLIKTITIRQQRWGGYLFTLIGTELIRCNWIYTKYSIAKSCSRFSKALYPTLREEWQHIIRQSNARLVCSNGDLLFIFNYVLCVKMSISSYGLLSCSIIRQNFM